MNRIGLKVNGIWCVLPQDVSISIEEQNPLFSDSGSYSYPIELSVSQNRELFKSIDSPHGRIRPQDIDGLPFELWYDGNMLLSGSIETDEDLDIDEDKCSINLVSGNGDFKAKIEGMQCTDVPLLDEIEIGNSYKSGVLDYDYTYNRDNQSGGYEVTEHKTLEIFLDEVNSMDFKAVNVSEPYPLRPYCNVRICTKRTDSYDKNLESSYSVLEADRPYSGLCFYIGYFLECLFSHLGIVYDMGNFKDVGDMTRLAFFTTKCDCLSKDEEEIELKNLSFSSGNVSFEILSPSESALVHVKNMKFKVKKASLVATEKNFPDVEVSSVVDSLFNAFGLKVVSDPLKNNVVLFFVRDIFRDNEIIDCPMKVRKRSVLHTKLTGVRMTYGGDEDDTAFNYKDYTHQNVRTFSDYKDVINNIQANDKSCYISQVTGNKYRIKIDKDAEEEGDEKNLNPSLFEVAQFADFVIGVDSENTHNLEISFTPLIENDTIAKSVMKDYEKRQQTLAVYIDGVELGAPSEETQKLFYVEVYAQGSKDGSNHTGIVKLKQQRNINYDRSSYEDNPFKDHDSGFTVGIMRGPGFMGGYEVFFPNYDGNGNSAWAAVAEDYAFTSDNMDAYGNVFDYNGTSEGLGYDEKDMISLKTHIQTAQDLGLKDKDGNDIDWGIDAQAAKRGLADRFMSEYMHFLLNRKTVSMDVDTTLSYLTSLSWFKQLRINNTVGRLKSRKYTLSNNGVSDMGIELYTIN